jgi:hypothetical protein
MKADNDSFKILKECGFEKCFYPNRVDEFFNELEKKNKTASAINDLTK